MSSVNIGFARWAALALAVSALAGCGGSSSSTPSVAGSGIPNLSDVKSAITAYHDSGEWAKEKDSVMKGAEDWIVFRAKHGGKLAIVLDIDETSLDNYPCYVGTDYGFIPATVGAWVVAGTAQANPAVLHFFQVAKANGIATFFVTGRPESLRICSAQNLDNAGYTGYDDLIMCPANYNNPSLVTYKSGARAAIEQQGYAVIANVGDQQSDMEGGHAEKQFKLPNPMYVVK